MFFDLIYQKVGAVEWLYLVHLEEGLFAFVFLISALVKHGPLACGEHMKTIFKTVGSHTKSKSWGGRRSRAWETSYSFNTRRSMSYCFGNITFSRMWSFNLWHDISFNWLSSIRLWRPPR